MFVMGYSNRVPLGFVVCTWAMMMMMGVDFLGDHFFFIYFSPCFLFFSLSLWCVHRGLVFGL